MKVRLVIFNKETLAQNLRPWPLAKGPIGDPEYTLTCDGLLEPARPSWCIDLAPSVSPNRHVATSPKLPDFCRSYAARRPTG